MSGTAGQGPEPRKTVAAETPREAIHIRLGSFALIFALVIAAISAAAGVIVVTIIFAVVALAAIVYMAVWIRRRGAPVASDGSKGPRSSPR
jgi:hypothetical protein